MNIVAVWSGGRYSTDHVRALQNQVRHYTGKKLITVGYDVPLQTDWRGWSAKIELFAPWQTFRPCLYLDLDTFILNPLPEIETPERLTMLRDFNDRTRANSGVMIIPENVNDIWEVPYDGRRADGDHLNQFPKDIIQTKYPDLVCSYKRHNCRLKKPNVPIMCFHGRPGPHDAPGWAGDYWRGAIENKIRS